MGRGVRWTVDVASRGLGWVLERFRGIGGVFRVEAGRGALEREEE